MEFGHPQHVLLGWLNLMYAGANKLSDGAAGKHAASRRGGAAVPGARRQRDCLCCHMAWCWLCHQNPGLPALLQEVCLLLAWCPELSQFAELHGIVPFISGTHALCVMYAPTR